MSRFLPHQELTSDQRAEFEEIMTNASRALLYCTNIFFEKDDRKSCMRFIEMLSSGTIDEMLEDGMLSPEISQDDIDSINAVKTIQAQVLQGYTKSIYSIVRNYAKSSYADIVQRDQFYDTAEDAALTSMYFYDNVHGVSYHTFVQVFVRNALNDLIRSFKTKNSKIKFVSESQLITKENKSILENVPESNSLYSDKDLELLQLAVKQSKLNPIQRELIEAYFAGGDGKRYRKMNVKKIITKHINPNSQKPYSSYQGTLELRRAQAIVIETYRLLMFQQVA